MANKVDEQLQDRLEYLKLLEQKVKYQELLPHIYGWKFYKWAKEYWDSTAKVQLICAANQISKAHPYSSLILTPSGFKRIEELTIGDYVISQDGEPAKVLDIPFDGEDECFEFTFDDGAKVEASKQHDWVCKGQKQRFRNFYTPSKRSKKGIVANPDFDQWTIQSTEQIIQGGKYSPGTCPWRRYSIPVNAAINFTAKKLFDPYLVGLLLGDGGMTGNSVIMTSADKQIVEYITRSYNAKLNSRYSYRLNGLQSKLRKIGLMGIGSKDKAVPKKYLRGSIPQRLSLLQGLLDTDGCVSKSGFISYISISLQLAKDVCYLVRSLGGLAEIHARRAGYKKNGEYIPCQTAFHVFIKIPVCPFRLPRKVQRYRSKIRYRHERLIYRIAAIGKKRCRCITVERGTYLVGKDLVVTHNSSTQIRKHIHWATAQDLWPALWRTTPHQFWYLYPTRDVSHIEFKKKWETEFMPRGEFRYDHPQYGWKPEYFHNRIFAIHWNSGVSTYFKTYAQDVQDLQTGTVAKLDLDEECPEELMSELMMRLAATDGYLSAVFTPTLGQEYWRQAVEGRGQDERFPEAFKKQVSMYDCLLYADGSRSPWTLEQIRRAENSCKNQNEIDRRIYGKFVVAEGLKYGAFHKTRNRKPGHPLPKNWSIWVGADIGSGGADNHPSAVAIVAVSPDWKEGRVIDGWRGDNEVTTAGDVVLKVLQMLKGRTDFRIHYDWGCRDFFTIATEMGLPVEPAEKSHAIGETVLNVLFKNQMLWVYDNPELDKLCTELSMLKNSTNKRAAKDDFIDALRYAVASVPWDWSVVRTDLKIETAKPKEERDEDRRRSWALNDEKLVAAEEEFEAFNELLGVGDGLYGEGFD